MLTPLLNPVRVLAAWFADWRSRQRALVELSSLDDRSLADIGLTRSEIPYVLSHPGYDRGPVTAPAANANHKHAA